MFPGPPGIYPGPNMFPGPPGIYPGPNIYPGPPSPSSIQLRLPISKASEAPRLIPKDVLGINGPGAWPPPSLVHKVYDTVFRFRSAWGFTPLCNVEEEFGTGEMLLLPICI
nr:galectin-3-like [Procambarus clarkii]